MTSNKIQFTLRLKEDLANNLAKQSKTLGISLNAFITMILAKEIK